MNLRIPMPIRKYTQRLNWENEFIIGVADHATLVENAFDSFL